MSNIDTQQSDETEIRDSADQEQKNKKKYTKDEITEENCRFEDGEELKFTRVRFPGHARSYAFLIGNRSLMYGQKVVAMSDRGMAVGYINSFPYKKTFNKDMLPIKSINKVASDDDIANEKEVYKRQKEIETTCQRLIDKHNLDMNLTHVEFTQFGKKVVFYFVAPARVDFRGLVKDLVGELKLRIELRQISVRDRAASMGALGPCGRELCCSSFLSRYGNVSIKMAKNQNLTLNYSKLNGVCGQLKCCLSYEEDVYSNKRNKLPQEGSFIETLNGDRGKVRKLNILNEQFDMLTDKGLIKRFTHDQVKKKLNKDYKFPERFENISDETGTVIGLKEYEDRKNHHLNKDKQKLEQKAAKFAIERIMEIADFLPPKDPTEREEMLKQANDAIAKSLEEKFEDKDFKLPQIESDENPYKQEDEVVVTITENNDNSGHQRPNNNRKRHHNNNRNRKNNRNNNARGNRNKNRTNPKKD